VSDIVQINVTDTEDGGKQLVLAVKLDADAAVQIADLLTRPAATTIDDVRERITTPAKKTAAPRKRTTRGRGGRK
jgi:hypothetical protein